MPVSAETLRLLMEAGIGGDELLRIVESIEADYAPVFVSTANAERQARYRERLGMRPAAWSALAAEIKERDNYTCGYCGSRLAPLHVDHIIPLIQGGTNDSSNLVTACQQCNSGKSGRTPEQWRCGK